MRKTSNGNTKRKGISPKIRFEVFKRDSFRCQYCGKASPDVILHVDHISPVSKGGGNQIINLVTSCADCNLGKGGREISDSSAIAVQREQLEQLQARREQLEMLMRWKEAWIENGVAEIDAACGIFEKCCKGYSLNERGRQSIAKLVKQFGLSRTMDAITAAASECLRYDDDGKIKAASVEITLRVAFIKCEPADIQALYKVRASVMRKWPSANKGWAMGVLRKAYNSCGDLDMVEDACLSAIDSYGYFSQWVSFMNAWTDEGAKQ